MTNFPFGRSDDGTAVKIMHMQNDDDVSEHMVNLFERYELI